MNTTEILLKFYRDRGISLEKVIDDPVFRSLPVQQQLAALRQNAENILAGVKPNGAAVKAKTIGVNMAKGIGAGAIGAMVSLLKNPDHTWEDRIFHAGAAVGIGAIAGAANGIRLTLADDRLKNTTNRYLQRLNEKGTTDEPAVELLSTRGTSSRPGPLVPSKYISDITPIGAQKIKQRYEST
jgi:hypothetical protein